MIMDSSFVNEQILSYIENLTAPQSELLAALERETYQKTVLPQMISGHYQGRLLSLLSRLKQPKNILEIGTFTGYATLCLAEGLTPDGQIITIDKNDEFQTIQNKYFEQSAYRKRIKQIVGNARDIIPKLETIFDLVFLDADKRYYPQYFEMILPKMSRGGLLIADNVLWYGKVLEPEAKDAETMAIKHFNEMVANDPRVEALILPVRDGLSIAMVI